MIIITHFKIRFFKLTKIICFVLAIVSFVLPAKCAEKVVYDDHQVWRVTPRNEGDVKLIERLGDANDVSIWNLSPNRADFLINNENRAKVHGLLQQNQLNHTVTITDVNRRILSTLAAPANLSQDALRVGGRMNWNSYPSLKSIEKYFQYLLENYASICKVISVGVSVENRTIKMVSISNGKRTNKQIVITAGQHAREWVAITSAFYIIDDIVANFVKQPKFVKDIDWHIIPLANPDGYEYTRTTDRLWRKNRRKYQSCYGVDINRNFVTDWQATGYGRQCKETYSGPHAFSEPESKAIRNVLTIIKKKKTPSAYIDIHAYGQMVIYPWSGKTTPTPDQKELAYTASNVVKAIYNLTKHKYKSGTAPKLLYAVKGAALDWFYARGVRFSYAIETRDLGDNGFLMPPHQIKGTGKEMLAAVKQIAKDLSPDARKKTKRRINKCLVGLWFLSYHLSHTIKGATCLYLFVMAFSKGVIH